LDSTDTLEIIPYYRLESLHFECTGCGACCRGDQHSYVFVEEPEAEAIRAQLGLSRRWFRRRYLRRAPGGELVLAWGTQPGHCVFLDEGGRCTVYAARPLQCRSYPFWPELVQTRAAWLREARRCEGIGRGAAVSSETVARALEA
jgi:Fe-S-cluster containining protein